MAYIDKAVFLYIFVFIAKCEAQGRNNDYQVPTPIVQALYPKGFRVTLKDDDYTFFGFRGNINKEFQQLHEYDIIKDVMRPKDGYWVYNNRDAKLELGDTIFYWIHIIKNKKGYMKTDLDYTVSEFVKADGTPVRGQPDQFSASPPIQETNVMDYRYNTDLPDCTLSKTKVQGQQNVCKDQLIFNEDFDQTTLRELKQWDAIIQFPTEPDNPFNMYIPNSTVSFEEGSFVVTPVLTESLLGTGFFQQTLDLNMDISFRCTGKADTPECKQVGSGSQIIPPVMTAKITTRRTFNFMFGRVEVRAKLPSGSWVMPEINLEPLADAYGPHNYESGLMRIAFVRGNPSLAKVLYGGPVLTSSDPFRSSLLQEKIGIDNWHRDYHNYTLIWRPDGIDLLVDGEQYGTVNPGRGFSEIAKKYNVGHATRWQKGTVMAPLDQMFHLTLGLRVGGINDFADDLEGKPWMNSDSKAMLNFWRNKEFWRPSWHGGDLRVDYVRVYAL